VKKRERFYRTEIIEFVLYTQDGVAIAAKVFAGGGSSYVGLSAEEAAALKAAKKEAEAGKKKEEVKENKAPYSR
jgi:hypothetical protein